MSETETIHNLLDELKLHLVERVRRRLYKPVALSPDEKRDCAHALDLFMDQVQQLSFEHDPRTAKKG